jgi:hypothetical protein
LQNNNRNKQFIYANRPANSIIANIPYHLFCTSNSNSGSNPTMIDWRKHIRLNRVFFRSTLLLSVSVGVLTGAYRFVMSEGDTVVSFIGLCLLGIPFGWILDLLYKELSGKKQYYFYYNQGISKAELWGVSFVLSCSFYFVFEFIVSLTGLSSTV